MKVEIRKNRVIIATAWTATAAGHVAGLLKEEVSTMVIAAAAVITIVWTQRERAEENGERIGARILAMAEHLGRRIDALADRVAELGRAINEMREQFARNMDQVQNKVLSADRIYGLGVVHDKLAEIRACKDYGGDDPANTGPFPMHQSGR